MKKFDKVAAQKYLDDLLKKYKIKVKSYSSSSCGRAWWKTREIKIPKPTNLDRFGVCLHEVKHIIDGNKGKRYEQEFACDLYALNIFKEMGYDTTDWESRMRWHSLSRITMAFNRGLNLATVSPEIKQFFKEINFDDWYGKSVFVAYSKTANIGYIISKKYTNKLTQSEVEILLNKRNLTLSKSTIDDSTYGRWLVKSGKWDEDFETLSGVVEHYNLS